MTEIRGANIREIMGTERPADFECPICLTNYTGDVEKITGCGHLFHEKCIDRWLEISNQCPVCRGNASNKAKPHGVPVTTLDLLLILESSLVRVDQALGGMNATVDRMNATVDRMIARFA